jgi:hypothetical protein
MDAENIKDRVTTATTSEEIDAVLPEITEHLQMLAERRLEIEARLRGTPNDKALAGELAALDAEQNRLKEVLDVAVARRAEMRNAAKRAQEDGLYAAIEKLTEIAGRTGPRGRSRHCDAVI